MGQPCHACQHPNRVKIEHSVISGQKIKSVARDFGISYASLRRHRELHMPEAIRKAEEARNLASGNALLDRIKQSHEDLRRILAQAEATRELAVAVNAIQAGLRALEIEGRLTGELSSGGPTINIALGMRVDVAQRRLAVLDEARSLSPREVAERAAACLRAYNRDHPSDPILVSHAIAHDAPADAHIIAPQRVAPVAAD